MQTGLEVEAKGKIVVVELVFKAELYGKGGIYYKITMGSDNEGLYYIQSIGNTSIEAVGSVKATVKYDKSTSKTKRTEKEQAKQKGVGVQKTFVILGEKTWWKGEKNRFDN